MKNENWAILLPEGGQDISLAELEDGRCICTFSRSIRGIIGYSADWKNMQFEFNDWDSMILFANSIVERMCSK